MAPPEKGESFYGVGVRGIEPPASRTPSERSADELHPEVFVFYQILSYYSTLSLEIYVSIH